MNYKRLQILNGIIFIVLVTVNLLIYKNRNNGYAYSEFLSYNQLYQAKENKQIEGFNLKPHGVLEVLSSKSNESFYINDSLNNPYKISGNPIIKLKKGIHTYTIQNINKTLPSIILGFNYITQNDYAASGREKDTDVELFYSNVSVQNHLKYTVNDWIQDSEYSTSDDLEKVKKLLRDSIHVQQNDSSLKKIKKIALYLLCQLDKNRGTPNSMMDTLSPLKQFECVRQKKSKLWCGNFANIFSYIASASGVKTRLICTAGKINEVYTSGHTFNECYISELNQWVMVDLTSKMISIQTPTKKYLNTVDLYQAHLLEPENLKVATFRNDSVVTTNYNSIKPFYDYYFNNNTQLMYFLNTQFKKNNYSFLSKIKRYCSSQPTFATYAGTQIESNEKFYIKKHMLVLLFSFTLWWLLFSVFHILNLIVFKKNV